jgi:hypothetical protein
MTRLGRGGRIVAGLGAGAGVGAGSGVGAGLGVLGTSASASASRVWTMLGGRIVAVEAGDGLRRAWRMSLTPAAISLATVPEAASLLT